jgi:hypothetical protein
MTPAGLCQPADEIAEFVRHLTDPRRRYLILRTFTRQISACDLLPHVRRSLSAPGREEPLAGSWADRARTRPTP